MALTKNDLNKISGIVGKTEKRMTNEIEDLAKMTKKEFDVVHKEISSTQKELTSFRKEDKREHKAMINRLNDIDFKISEVVRKEEFLKLEERVRRIETKLGLGA